MRALRRVAERAVANRKAIGKRTARDRRRQRDVLRDVLLSAEACETWLTLDELAKLTHYPPASISAQLRHLRKPEFGGYAVEKRQRRAGRILRGEDFGTVWEYQLLQGVSKRASGANLVKRAHAKRSHERQPQDGI